MPSLAEIFLPAQPNETAGMLAPMAQCNPNSLLAFRRLIHEGCDPKTGKKLGVYGLRDAVQQAMSSTDFTNALSTDMNVTVKELYNNIPHQLARICSYSTVPDFNSYPYVAVGGGQKPMAQFTPEGGVMSDALVDRTLVSRQVKPYGKTMSLRWDAVLADIRGVFARIPQVLAMSAANTVEHIIASALFSTTGWGIDTAQSSIGNTVLSITSLAAAYVEMTQYLNPIDSIPMAVMPMYLLHSPGLTIEVDAILNSTELRDPSALGKYGIANVIARRGLIPIEAHWPNYRMTGAVAARKGAWWGLFADPAAIPVCEYSFLEGLEGPQIFYRAPDRLTAGGSPDPRGWATNTFDTRGEVYCGAVAIVEASDSKTRGAWLSNGITN